MTTCITSPQTKLSLPLLLVLIVAGLAGNYFNFPIFLNIDFVFGSIFAILALQFFGTGRGIFAAAVISSYTYFLWNEPYAMMIMTAEVAVVSCLIGRRKMGLVLADALYWLIIGMPLGYFFYYVALDIPLSNAFIIMTKQAVNGITNALVARLIFNGIALRWRLAQTSFKDIVYNLLAFFVLCPTLIMLAVESRTDFAETDRTIRTLLGQCSQDLDHDMKTWVENRKTTILYLAEMAASRSPEQMQTLLKHAKNSDVNFLRIGLLNRNAVTTAYFPVVDELGQSNLGRSFAERPFIPVLKQTLQPMLSEVVMGKIGTPKPVVSMLAPVLIGGEYGGYVIGVLGLDQVQEFLEKGTGENGTRYTLLDKNNNIILTNRADQKIMTPFLRAQGTLTRRENGVSQWVPALPPIVSASERWKESLYVMETSIGDLSEWKLMLEQPVAPYQKILYEHYAGKLTLLFLILLGALALAEIISRTIVVTFEKLRLITSDLPDRLAKDGKDITWPESGVVETNNLISDFRGMASSLSQQFTETRNINESLEQQVHERTSALSIANRNLEQEISERILAQDAVKEREQHITLLFNSLSEGIYGSDLKNLCTFCNPAALRLLGYTREEDVLGRNIHELIHHTKPDGSPYPQEDCKIFHCVRSENSCHADNEVFWRSDGTSFPVEYWTQPIMREGASIGVITTFVDISERKRVERDLKIKNNAIEESINGIAISDLSGIMTYVNRAYVAMLGYDRADEIIGRPITAFAEHGAVTDEIRASVAKSGRWIGELSGKRKDGSLIPRLMSVSLLTDEDGKTISFLGSFLDITEHRKLEEQLRQSQKMESIGTLAGGVAHDFNNILTAISGYGHLVLMKMEQGDPLRQNIQQILESADRAAHLTKDLLLFSRKQQIERKLVDLNEGIRKLAKFLARVIGEDIAFNTVLFNGIIPVLADTYQIDQILMNLATNARDAMQGGGTFTIATELISLDEAAVRSKGYGTPGRYALMTVSDTGSGMEEKTLQHIFEPFFTTKEVGKGTGLGLSVVYGIVKQHEGLIEVSSEPCCGATFMIYLPLTETDALSEPQVLAEETPAGGDETILIAEDDNTVREMSAMILEEFGYTVITAVDGEEAVKKFMENKDRIQLLLFDLIMPKKSGKDAYDEILKLQPKMKIIFASGYDPDLVRQKALLEQHVPVVYKPVPMAVLLKKIREVMDKNN